MAAGVVNARAAYDDPGALLMRLRMEEPEEFAACAGAGVQGLVPDLADFWRRYLVAARDRGEIHPDIDIAEASEWVARVIISLVTVPGDTLDPSDRRPAHAYSALRDAGPEGGPGRGWLVGVVREPGVFLETCTRNS